MVKKELVIESKLGAISEAQVKKKINAELKRLKVKAKEKITMYFNTVEYKCYCVIDGTETIIIDLTEVL